MKNVSVLLLGFIILLSSCKSKNSNTYTIEIRYIKTSLSGADSTITNNTESFTSSSDSAAYLKAQKDFTDARAKHSTDNKGVPVKFTVRNNKGNVVLAPGYFKSQEIEETLYPNQKPKEPGN